MQERSQNSELMGTPLQLRMLPRAAEVEEPTAVFCGKEVRKGSGRTTVRRGLNGNGGQIKELTLNMLFLMSACSF